MTHPTPETLVAYIDGELSGLAQRHTERHLAGCRACTEALAEIDQSGALFGYALRWVDECEPAEWRAGSPAAALLSRARPAAPWRPAMPAAATTATTSRPALWRWAAGLVLLSGAAAAAIGAPLLAPRVFDRTPAPAPAVAPAPAAHRGAVAVIPDAGTVDVVLAGTADRAHVLVVFADRADVHVDFLTTPAPAVAARDGHIRLQFEAAGAAVRLTVPARLQRGRILLDDVPLAWIAQGRLADVRTRRGITIDSGPEDR